jgi:hypothetical protein
MRTPTDLERDTLVHLYDPQKAHEYYLKNRELKGRKPGQGEDASGGDRPNAQGPLAGKTKMQIAKDARTKQRHELAAAVTGMEQRLQKLESMIRKKEAALKRSDQIQKAKKNKAAKEKDKPKTAAEKAKASRENEKYRDKHKQSLKSKAKKDHGGGKKDGKDSGSHKHSISELKSLATKVKGQLAVAKQKLAAL